jgi:hypothetical protein
MRRGVLLVTGLFVFGIFSSVALAQQVESAGAIRGVVTDPGGGVIVGASVVAENHDLRVVSGLTLTQDIALPVGETTQVVSVVAQAELVDSSSTATANTRVSEEIKDLPLPLPASWRTPGSYLDSTPTSALEQKSSESAGDPTWVSGEAMALPAVLPATPLTAFRQPPT